jgi:hypothetical protein
MRKRAHDGRTETPHGRVIQGKLSRRAADAVGAEQPRHDRRVEISF